MVVLRAGDAHLALLALPHDVDHAVDLGDLRLALRHARLEQLLDAGKTAGDVETTGDAAEVEGAHRQLRARLADRLRGDDADRLAHLDELRRAPGCGRSRAGRCRAWPRR